MHLIRQSRGADTREGDRMKRVRDAAVRISVRIRRSAASWLVLISASGCGSDSGSPPDSVRISPQSQPLWTTVPPAHPVARWLGAWFCYGDHDSATISIVNTGLNPPPTITESVAGTLALQVVESGGSPYLVSATVRADDTCKLRGTPGLQGG